MVAFRTKVKPPATVTAEGRTDAATGNTYINVTWPAAPAAGSPIVNYVVYRNGAALGTLAADARSYSDATALVATSYTYAVAVVSESGATSAQRKSNAVTRPQTVVGAGNWETRISGPSVVWHHNFENDAEAMNFIRIPNDAAQQSTSAPNGYVINGNITLGVHDPIFHLRRVQDAGTSSGWAIEVTSLGGQLAADVTPEQDYIDVYERNGLQDLFPDPGDDPNKFYWLSIHADEDAHWWRLGVLGLNLWPPGASVGKGAAYDSAATSLLSKGWKECVAVSSKEDLGGGVVRLHLAARALNFGEQSGEGQPRGTISAIVETSPNLVVDILPTNYDSSNDVAWSFAGGTIVMSTARSADKKNNYFGITSAEWQATTPPVLRVTTSTTATVLPTVSEKADLIVRKRFLAHTPVGQDSDGGWNRPFGAVDGTINGRGVPDPAASGTVTVHTTAEFTPGAQGQQPGWGSYATPWYQTCGLWPASWFDGDEHWFQFRCWFSLSRNDPQCLRGKMYWHDNYGIGAQHEYVTTGPGWKALVGSTAEDYVIENFIDTYSNFGLVDLPRTLPDVDYVLGEWMTFNVRMKCGYAEDDVVPRPGKNGGLDNYGTLTVLTDQFTPTNEVEGDGVRRLRFETTAPPNYIYLPSENSPGPNGETLNRRSPGYFSNGGWRFQWPSTSAWLSVTEPTVGTQFNGGDDGKVVEAVLSADGTRMRWAFAQRGVTAMTTGVPSHGHRMQLQVYDYLTAFPDYYRRAEWEMWMKRDGQDPVQVFDVKGFITVMGKGGTGTFVTNAPSYNGCQFTQYGNIWDNLAPRPSMTSTRWADFIFSKAPIPWPDS